MKRYHWYLIVSGGALLIGVTLSRIFGFSTENTWQGLVIVDVVFVFLFLAGWDATAGVKAVSKSRFLLFRGFLISCLLAGLVCNFLSMGLL